MGKLGIFEADPDSFLEGFLMVDEVWVNHYQPNMKDQYYQWKSLGYTAPKKPITVKWTGSWSSEIRWGSPGGVL